MTQVSIDLCMFFIFKHCKENCIFIDATYLLLVYWYHHWCVHIHTHKNSAMISGVKWLEKPSVSFVAHSSCLIWFMGCGNHCIVIMYIMKPCSIKFYFEKLSKCSYVFLNRLYIYFWTWFMHYLFIDITAEGYTYTQTVFWLISGVKWFETCDTAFSKFIVLILKHFV